MTDDHDQPTPTDLEQLARSISMDGSVGRHDAQTIADALRRLAAIERTNSHPGRVDAPDGCPPRSAERPARRLVSDADRDEVRRLVESGLTFNETARPLEWSPSTIQNIARAWGCGHRCPRGRKPSVARYSMTPTGWRPVDAGRSIADVADELGVHYGTVVTARQRHGTSPTRAPKRPIDIDEVRRRLAAGESMGSIGRALGHTSSAI